MSFSIDLSSLSLQNEQNEQVSKTKQNTLPQLNSYDTAREFCSLFYGGMYNKGYISVLNLFDQNALCNYAEKEYIGAYNIALKMTSEGIMKTRYDKLNCTVLPINNTQISVQVIGLIQGVTLTNQLTSTYKFTDTFILTLKDQNRIYITSYVNKLF